MNFTERINSFLRGEKPDRIPFSINQAMLQRNTPDDPIWQEFFNKGLGINYPVRIFKEKSKNIEHFSESSKENGKKIIRKTMRTPVGDLTCIQHQEGNSSAWTQKHWIENEADYKVMTYIVKNTEIIPDFNVYKTWEKDYSQNSVHKIALGRTPMQVILVDYVGLENFAYHLIDCEEPMMELYEALLVKLTKKVELAAEGPGLFVWFLENFTSETMGPQRFEKFHMPVYNKLFPMLKSSGKLVGVHYDGKLKSCKELIAKAPIDVIESLTPPPEGDMTLKECREAWPDKLFWSNINVSAYQLPREELKKLLIERVNDASVNGCKLAYELSEEIPENWRESIPLVLDILKEIS